MWWSLLMYTVGVLTNFTPSKFCLMPSRWMKCAFLGSERLLSWDKNRTAGPQAGWEGRTRWQQEGTWGRRGGKGRTAPVDKTRNKVKTSEDSFGQLSLFLSPKVLSGFCHSFWLTASYLLPFLLSHTSPLAFFLLHWRDGGSNRACSQQGTSCGQLGDTPASWKLLKQGTATRCSGVFPCYIRVKCCKDGCYCGNTGYRKGSVCHQDKETNNVPVHTVLYKDKQISSIQNGMHIQTVTFSVLWCLKQSSWVERF